MNDAWLLVGLIALAYVGSLASAHGGLEGFVAHTGALYLVLGFLLGPSVGGVLERATIDGFHVVAQVGASWLALLAGLGSENAARRAFGRASLGVLLTAFVGAGVATAAWFGLAELTSLPPLERALLAAGAGVCYCASGAPFAIVETGAATAPGPFTRALLDVARASSLVPAVGVAALFAFAPGHGLAAYSPAVRVAATLATGVVLGVLAALLLGREFRQNESWGLLLGVTLLGAGAAARVGLSAVTVSFMLGLTISAVSRHRAEIRTMVGPSERAVLLPVAMLAGASARVETFVLLFSLALLGVKFALDWVRGSVVRLLVPAARPPGVGIGLSLSLPGPLALAAGVELEQSLPPALGAPLLVAAMVVVVAGEIVGSLEYGRRATAVGEAGVHRSEPGPPGRGEPAR